MSGVKVTTLLGNAEKLIRELKLAVPATKARVVRVIQQRTKAVVQGAKARVHVVSGVTRSTIRDEYSNDSLIGFARVGFGKLPRRSQAQTAKGIARAKARKRTVGKGAWAPVLERGDPRTHRRAFPFLIPSFDSQKAGAMADIDRALNDTMKEIT